MSLDSQAHETLKMNDHEEAQDEGDHDMEVLLTILSSMDARATSLEKVNETRIQLHVSTPMILKFKVVVK